MSLLSFLGCRTSTTELPETADAIRVTIDIEQRTERQPGGRDPYEVNHVNVVLADGTGAAIEKPDVRVMMNGEPLEFRVGQGNYYDRHPRYTLPRAQEDTLRPDTEYRFAVTLPDGQQLEAGTVRTPKPLALDEITVPEVHQAGRALEITWRALAQPIELVAYHGFEYPDEAGNLVQESGSVNADDVLRRTVGPAAGTYSVPASYFAASGRKRVASFGVEVSRAMEVPLGSGFAKGSRIRAVRTATFRTELPR
jgi:hypothetical protein